MAPGRSVFDFSMACFQDRRWLPPRGEEPQEPIHVRLRYCKLFAPTPIPFVALAEYVIQTFLRYRPYRHAWGWKRESSWCGRATKSELRGADCVTPGTRPSDCRCKTGQPAWILTKNSLA